MRAVLSPVRAFLTSLTAQIIALRFVVEATLIGLFFIQALRYLIGALYGRVASASIYPAIDQSLLDPENPIPGLLSPQVVSNEITLLAYLLALPLLSVVIGRAQALGLVAVVVAAVGRALMSLPDAPVSAPVGAALVIGGGLLYIAQLIRHRATLTPYLFVIGFLIDQLLRASGNTLDPSLFAGWYVNVQIALSVGVMALALVNLLRPMTNAGAEARGLLTVWGGVGMGALLFIEMALLAVPNAVAGRSGFDYTALTPLLILATALPLIPWLRNGVRGFIALFDGSLRGWAWMLLVALMVVLGLRFDGVIAGAALVIGQFCVSLMWWWLARPQAEKERNFSGLWVIIGMGVFGLLTIADLFTYEYAYVREFADPLTFLNPIVPPLLRGFRGLGLVIFLLAVFFSALPMIQAQRRLPWKGGSTWLTVTMSFATVLVTLYGAYIVRPPLIQGVRDVEQIRIATYNIHAGFNEFFHYDMEAIARTIQQSGANVVLLQEVEAGRLTSFGVDQPLWLARRLGMDRRFFPTNEGLQGLAVLSNIRITEHEGFLLTSAGNQTGVQRVVLDPDEGEISIYNTWLGLLVEGAGGRTISQQEQDQQRQLNELLAIVSAYASQTGTPGRLVIGGTFNNIPDSDLIQQMRATGLNDPFEAQPPAQSHTLRQTGRQARLDYLWTNMLALGAIVVDSRASDHALAVIGVQIAR